MHYGIIQSTLIQYKVAMNFNSMYIHPFSRSQNYSYLMPFHLNWREYSQIDLLTFLELEQNFTLIPSDFDAEIIQDSNRTLLSRAEPFEGKK